MLSSVKNGIKSLFLSCIHVKIDNTREQLDFVLLDLIRLSQNKIVLCDCHLTVEEAEKYTEASRIVFLIKEPSNLIEDYCGRSDHQGFRDFIYSTSDETVVLLFLQYPQLYYFQFFLSTNSYCS